MTVEEIIKEFQSSSSRIAAEQQKQAELIKSLQNFSTQDFNWITVKNAATRLDKSVQFVYSLINRGKITGKYIGGATYVDWGEIVSLNDKYSA